MTPWAFRDPLDRALAAWVRHPGPRRLLTTLLLLVIAIHALSLLTLPLERLSGISALRRPFQLFQTLTQTQQEWAMFKEFPHAHFDLKVHVGRTSGEQFVQLDSWSPVIPDWSTFDPAGRFRYYLFFLNTFTQGSPERIRDHYFDRLKAALQQRVSSMPESSIPGEDRPTHFVIELEVVALGALRNLDASAFPLSRPDIAWDHSPSTSHETGRRPTLSLSVSPNE